MKNDGLDSYCNRHPLWCICVQEVHEMNQKKHKCSTIKEYDGKFRCLECFKEYHVAKEEEAMSAVLLQSTPGLMPAMKRIQELESEVKGLRATVEAMKVISKAMRNPKGEKDTPHDPMAFRPTVGGQRKDTNTGEVYDPSCYCEFPKDLGNNRG